MLTLFVRTQEVLGSNLGLWSAILTAVKRNVRAVLLLWSTGKRYKLYRFEHVTLATRAVGNSIQHTFQTDGQIPDSGMYLTVSPEIYTNAPKLSLLNRYINLRGLNIGKSDFFRNFKILSFICERRRRTHTPHNRTPRKTNFSL